LGSFKLGGYNFNLYLWAKKVLGENGRNLKILGKKNFLPFGWKGLKASKKELGKNVFFKKNPWGFNFSNPSFQRRK